MKEEIKYLIDFLVDHDTEYLIIQNHSIIDDNLLEDEIDIELSLDTLQELYNSL